ncbi:hypothetical protein ACOME3_006775 [Neoechinorhynchus agilis]
MKLLLEDRREQNTGSRMKISGFRSFFPAKEEWTEYETQLGKDFGYCGVTDDDVNQSCLLAWMDQEVFVALRKHLSADCEFTEITKALRDIYKSEIHEIAARYRFFNRPMHKPDVPGVGC